MMYPWLQQTTDLYSDIMRRLEAIFPDLELNDTTFDQFWEKERQAIFHFSDLYGIFAAEAIVYVLINKYGVPESKIEHAYNTQVTFQCLFEALRKN